VSTPNLNALVSRILNAKDAELFAEERKGFPLRPLRKTLRPLRLINSSPSLKLFGLAFLLIISAITVSAQRKTLRSHPSSRRHAGPINERPERKAKTRQQD